MAKKVDTTMPILTHILGLLTGFLGPLIILLAVDDNNAKNHARYALNWQLSLMIYIIISIVLLFVVVGIFLMIALFILDLIFCIIAAVRAGENELYQYPLSIPFFR